MTIIAAFKSLAEELDALHLGEGALSDACTVIRESLP